MKHYSIQLKLFSAKSIFLFLALYFVHQSNLFAQTRTEQTIQTKDTPQFPPSNSSNVKLTYKIIPSVKKTWGYDIYMEGRLLVHQPSIPGLPGNDGFKNKQDAQKVANLVITKMRKGENPPSVTIQEMKTVKVI